MSFLFIEIFAQFSVNIILSSELFFNKATFPIVAPTIAINNSLLKISYLFNKK